MTERFESHTRTFSLLTLVSRLTGLGRDAVLSRFFGATYVMDAFFFAFIVPNLFRRLFGEGVVAAAFLRPYAQLERSDPATARKLATLTIAVLLAVLGGVTLAGEAVLIVISARSDHEHLVVRLTMIMLPFMPLVCVVAILGAMLQVHGRFGPSASVPIVLNLCLIGTAAGLAPVFGPDAVGHVTAVAVAVLVAGVLQVAWMLWALRDRPWIDRDVAAARKPMREVVRHAGPMILGLGVLQLNAFLDGLIASYPTTIGPTILGAEYPLREGAMAAVTFAQRLYQFPLGVFGIAVATAIFPALARQAGDDEHFTDIVRRGLRLVVFVGVPASAGLMMVGPTLVGVIYEGGQFGAADARRVTSVLYGYASGVWAYSMIHVLTRAYYAKRDAKTPVVIALYMVALNFGLNCTLIWTPLREAGLAWSTAACATIQVGVLLALVRRHTQRIADAGIVRGAIKTAGVTVLMALAVGAVLAALPQAESWGQSLLTLLAAVGTGLVVVAGAATLLRMPELRWLLSRPPAP